jgi:hypothetical protein
LAHHLLHQQHHALQLATQPLQHGLPRAFRLLDAVIDLLGKAFGLPDYPGGCRA